MKPTPHFVQSETFASELARLSCDPALTFRPDPAFRAKFRNPDEIMEGDFNGIDAGTRSASATPPCWAYTAAGRRSLKD
jgi:hypothetical protein